MAKIIVDRGKCGALALHILTMGGIPPDREDPMPLSFPKEVAENAWWTLVGVNHQTTPVVGTALRGYVKGRLLRGWDYLLQKAIYQSTRLPGVFTAEWLRNVTEESLREFYHDDIEGDTISRPASRAALLNDMGEFLGLRGWGSINRLYVRSGGWIQRGDGTGIGEIMPVVRAYADPVRKKLFYFLAIMRNEGLWTYRDPENLSSPVNYHEQRGHFRLGTVKILDETLRERIARREEITAEEDIEIRLAVRSAIEEIARLTGSTPSATHYYFWNFFRNCCSRGAVHCTSCPEGCGLPERYRYEGKQSCAFAPVCASVGRPVAEMLIEPRLDDTTWQ